jgi:hypothetical protein
MQRSLLLVVTLVAVGCGPRGLTMRFAGFGGTPVYGVGPGRPPGLLPYDRHGSVVVRFAPCEENLFLVAKRRGCRPELAFHTRGVRPPPPAPMPCRPLAEPGRALLAGIVYEYGAGGRRCNGRAVETLLSNQRLRLSIDGVEQEVETEEGGMFEVAVDPGSHTAVLSCIVEDNQAGCLQASGEACNCQWHIDASPGETELVDCGCSTTLYD